MPAAVPIRKRLGVWLLALVVLAAAPLAVLHLTELADQRAQARRDAARDLDRAAERVATRTRGAVRRAHDILVTLKTMPSVTRGDPGACNRTLARLADRFPERFTNFSRVDAKRRIVCSSGPLPEPVDVSDSPNIREAFETGRFAVSPFKKGVLTDRRILVFSEPLTGPDGTVTGTVNTGLALTWLAESLKRLDLPPGARVAVVTGDGTLLARHPGDDATIGADAGDRPVMRAAQGERVVTGPDGERRVAGRARLGQLPGGAWVVATRPEADVLAPVNQHFYVEVSALAGVLLVSLIGVWLLTRYLVVGPVRRLVTVADRLAEGDLSARSGLAERDSELGHLAAAYDRMAERLEARDAELRDSNARYERLVTNLSDHFLYAHDRDGRFRWVSPSVQQVLGYDPAELGERYSDLLTDSPVNASAQAHTAAALQGGKPPVYEVEVHHRDGRPRTLEVQETPVFDATGSVVAVEGIAHDTTERRAMEENLRHTLRELERSNRDLEQFAYTASHNMAEPLRMVNTQIQFLERRYRDDLPAPGQAALDTAADGASRLKALVQALLAYSRVAVEGRPFDTVDLDEIFGAVLDALHDTIAETEAAVTAERPLPAVLGDREQLFQLLYHLLGNALRYHHPDRVPAIHVAADRPPGEQDWLRVAVQDNGRGIDPDDLERLFQIYRRPDLHGREAEGAGIGLAAARRIVERHGGRIWLDSDGASGTTVTFTLPVPEEGP